MDKLELLIGKLIKFSNYVSNRFLRFFIPYPTTSSFYITLLNKRRGHAG